MKILKSDYVSLYCGPLVPTFRVYRIVQVSRCSLKSWNFSLLYSSFNYWKAYHFWKARKGSGVVLVAE